MRRIFREGVDRISPLLFHLYFLALLLTVILFFFLILVVHDMRRRIQRQCWLNCPVCVTFAILVLFFTLILCYSRRRLHEEEYPEAVLLILSRLCYICFSSLFCSLSLFVVLPGCYICSSFSPVLCRSLSWSSFEPVVSRLLWIWIWCFCFGLG